MSDKVRVQFDMSAAAVARLDALADDTGSATRREVVSKALTVYELLCREVRTGGEVHALLPDGKTKVLLLPGLSF